MTQSLECYRDERGGNKNVNRKTYPIEFVVGFWRSGDSSKRGVGIERAKSRSSARDAWKEVEMFNSGAEPNGREDQK